MIRVCKIVLPSCVIVYVVQYRAGAHHMLVSRSFSFFSSPT